MPKNDRDINGELGQYAVTNIAVDRTLDCNANSDLATADVLGTLIQDLIARGIISGTVA